MKRSLKRLERIELNLYLKFENADYKLIKKVRVEEF